MGEPLRFGRYEVSGTIGRGAMGVVYLAEDPIIRRKVAIKVVEAFEGIEKDERDQLEARFEREFQSAGLLSHPNIVAVHDVGHDEDGNAFIAMEYVAGESLQDILAESQPFTLAEIADIAAELCSGLDYAHGFGIVHRDIKPANILVTRDGRPKITDFGVARVATTTLTRTGSLVGTPAYMSPEQVTGNPVDGAADQFSLAVMLYQMFTGKRPFIGDTPNTMMWQIVHEEPPAPTTVNSSLPAPIDDALMRALAKSPEDRYAKCGDLAKVLRSALGSASSSPTVVSSDPNAETVVTNPDAAAARQEQAEKQERAKIDSLLDEARNLQESGDLKAAVRSARKALDIDPDHAPAKRLLTAAEAELDARGRSEREIQELLAAAIEHERAGRYGEAIEVIREIFLLDPEEPTAKRLASNIERQQKARREAIDSLPSIDRIDVDGSSDTAESSPGLASGQAARLGAIATAAVIVAAAVWFFFFAAAPTGRLIVNEVPWAYVVAVVDGDGVDHLASEVATPMSLALPPGSYTVTLNAPDGQPLRTEVVEIGSATTSAISPTGEIDVGAYFREAGWR